MTKTTASRKAPAKAIKEKYVAETENLLNNFTPTARQMEAINIGRKNTISFLTGPAGTGKTSAILWDFCKEYLRDNTKKIVVVRAPMEAGQLDKIGFLPNSLEEKTAPHFESTKEILNNFLGKNKVDCDTGKRIQLLIPNYMIGRTIDNALVLVDEAQVLQPMILKLILERTGINSRVIVTGDPSQLYTGTQEAKLRNGLSDAIMKFAPNGKPKYENIGFYKFNVDGVMRSDIVKTVIQAYGGE